jgi:hypothetical protein
MFYVQFSFKSNLIQIEKLCPENWKEKKKEICAQYFVSFQIIGFLSTINLTSSTQKVPIIFCPTFLLLLQLKWTRVKSTFICITSKGTFSTLEEQEKENICHDVIFFLFFHLKKGWLLILNNRKLNWDILQFFI